MSQQEEVTTKENVNKFDDDVRKTGSYAYTTDKVSAQFANARISQSIQQSYDFVGKSVLDLGCGDGAYTLEFPSFGVKEIVGIDPANAAIDSANAKAKELGLDDKVHFEVGNIYALESFLEEGRFDCIILRGVLHHLPDAERAILGLASFDGTIVVLEPNGHNPVLKLLEKFSRYHIEHEERSFSPATIKTWLKNSGFTISSSEVVNLVPYFCPDWMAKTLRFFNPLAESIPIVRSIACGQVTIVGKK